MKIEPAAVEFRDGTPFSERYDDVYHSAESGPGQARHVFLGGNDLPSRWAGARVFTVFEIGFGLGLNFLATWHAWREDPSRPERLHFVSVEKHPFTRDALAALHARYPDFPGQSHALQSGWPLLVPGMHRLEFESGRVVLTIAFSDAIEVVPRLRFAADALYLDGFAPERNPDLWSPKIFQALARLAAPGTTVATYSAARAVREGLDSVGFVLEKRPGFGRKRDMLCGRYAPRWKPRRPFPARPKWPERRVLVVGASLAGAAACERLGARGWQVELIERHPEPAAEARHVGVFHPHVSPDDCLLSRLARNAFLHAIQRWQSLQQAGLPIAWQRCGVLQQASDAPDEASMVKASAALGYPFDYARHANQAEASDLVGRDAMRGGWWFPQGGWIRPSTLICAQIATARQSPGVRTHFATNAAKIVFSGGTWRALSHDGTSIAEAPVVLLANAGEAERFAPLGQPLKRSRGQITYLPAQPVGSLRAVLIGKGYLTPAVDGVSVLGSTYDMGKEVLPTRQGHDSNLERLARLLPSAPHFDPATLEGAVGFRSASPDRLPVIGPLPDLDCAHERRIALSGAHVPDVPCREGLFGLFGLGSRGLLWAALGAEVLASLLEGEPLPVEGDLADAIDPRRFAMRIARRSAL